MNVGNVYTRISTGVITFEDIIGDILVTSVNVEFTIGAGGGTRRLYLNATSKNSDTVWSLGGSTTYVAAAGAQNTTWHQGSLSQFTTESATDNDQVAALPLYLPSGSSLTPFLTAVVAGDTIDKMTVIYSPIQPFTRVPVVPTKKEPHPKDAKPKDHIGFKIGSGIGKWTPGSGPTQRDVADAIEKRPGVGVCLHRANQRV